MNAYALWQMLYVLFNSLHAEAVDMHACIAYVMTYEVSDVVNVGSMEDIKRSI